jgi:hypothetical protein
MSFNILSMDNTHGVFCPGKNTSCPGFALTGSSTIPSYGIPTSRQVTFIPTPGTSGANWGSFTFVTHDAQYDSNKILVIINVIRINHPPVAQDFIVNMPQDTTAPCNFTTRLSDIDQGFTATPGVYGAYLYAVIASLPDKGVLKRYTAPYTPLAIDDVVGPLTPGGVAALYTPVAGDFSYRQPPGPPATYTSFTYRALDDTTNGMYSAAVGTVTVQVSYVYTKPVVQDFTASIPEDTNLNVLLQAVSRGNPTASFTFRLKTITSPTRNCLTNPDETKLCTFSRGDGTPINTNPFSQVTLTNNVFNFLPGLDEFGDNYAFVTYTADDGTQESDPATITINVIPVNDPPKANLAPPFSGPEDDQVIVTLSGTDVDGPLNPTEIVLVAPNPPNGRIYTYNAANTVNFRGTELVYNSTPPLPDFGGQVMIAVTRGANKFVFVPNPNWNGITRSYYRAWDGYLFSSPSTTRLLTIIITPVNDPPTIVFLDPATLKPLEKNEFRVTPGEKTLLLPLIGDIDADENPNGQIVATVTYGQDVEFQTAASAAIIGPKITNAAAKTVSFTVTGSLTQVKSTLASVSYKRQSGGTDTLTIKVNDQGNTGAGGPKEATASLAITIAPPPVPPVAVTDATGIVVGAAFAGVFGAAAAYLGWTKLNPKLYQQNVDPFAGTGAGGENPIFQGQGFHDNILYESR